jgi:IclR family pca regulon transcriptional regulator
VQSDDKLFWLTPRVLRLGQSYPESARLPRIVQAFSQRGIAGTRESAYVKVTEGYDIARKGASRAMNTGYVLGTRTEVVRQI